MYFRARWRVGHDLLSSYEQPSDIPYLMTSGKGVCVGAAAHLMNPSDVPSVYGNWWGEGDEKIFVDDNPYPVFLGTGSEDYFNYAWSSPDLFDYAYCGQPRDDGPGTKGFVTNYRWHIIDNIPFENQFAFYMELLSHEPVPGFRMPGLFTTTDSGGCTMIITGFRKAMCVRCNCLKNGIR